MDLPREIEKCVAYVAYQTQSNSRGELAGTCLLIVRRSNILGFNLFWALTARHVVEHIEASKVYRAEIRVNVIEEGAVIQPPLSRWFFPPDPDVDLAAACLTEAVDSNPERWDHWAMPWEMIVPESINGRDPRQVALGDDIFVTGMFYQHHGKYRNSPIVRSGNIAAMPEERIVVELGPQNKTREAWVEGYLVELHSQQGLSGSPVFVVEARERNVLNVIRGAVTLFTPRSRQPIYLLGLITHHFSGEGKGIQERLGSEKAEINYGIAVSVPHYKIAEFFDSPEIKAHEAKLIQGKQDSLDAARNVTAFD
jgi:hypothetical protein